MTQRSHTVPKPIIALAPGAWHVPAHFELVSRALAAAGYSIQDIELPGTTYQPRVNGKLLGIEEDTAAIREAVVSQLDGGNDVVLVTHSYSSIPGAAALAGLSREAREATGTSTSVVGIVIISGFLLPPGTTMLAAMGGAVPPQYLHEDNLTTPFNGPGAIHVLFHDLEQVAAEKAVWRLKPQSYGINTSPVPDQVEGLSGIPIFYLACRNDQAVPWEAQSGTITGLKAAGYEVSAEVATSGHSPFLKLPRETTLFIRRAAGEGVETGFDEFTG